jgi:hypothetical protein
MKEEKSRVDQLEQPRKSIVKFLEKKGWKVFLVGNTGVVKNPNREWRKHMYWFVMEFIGKKGE